MWLQTWWEAFGDGLNPSIWTVKHGDTIIGIAPLCLKDNTAVLIGDTHVCDYLDFIVAPGRENEFYDRLLEHLEQLGIGCLELKLVRHDSSVIKFLVEVAKHRGWTVFSQPESVSYELELPPTWDDYLTLLTGKQRHEVRRKIRRLDEAAAVGFRVVHEVSEVRDAMATFLTFFKGSRPDKAAFMTPAMESFFYSLAEAMARTRILKLFFLDIDQTPAATVMCFDYASRVYLYNNGYDKRFRSLSVGWLSKVFSIKESIESGRKTYDFLKGTETYKHRLGGQPVSLYRCRLKFR
jgi:CelD/BcsL family acetyltransferase involved in cellulose biosynthesis